MLINTQTHAQTPAQIHAQAHKYSPRAQQAILAKSAKRHSRGTSLINVLVCLSIIAIFSVLSLQANEQLILNIQAKAELNALHDFLKNTRKTALLKQVYISVCSLDEHECDAQWGKNLHSFIDVNKNMRIDINHEQLVHTLHLQRPYSFIKSSKLKNLRLSPLGMNDKIGSLYFCFVKGSYVYARKISASLQGRFKIYSAAATVCL